VEGHVLDAVTFGVRTSITELRFVHIDTGDVPGLLRQADRDRAGPAPHVDHLILGTEEWQHEVRVLRGAPVPKEDVETHAHSFPLGGAVQ
jgi:hypothetical protein